MIHRAVSVALFGALALSLTTSISAAKPPVRSTPATSPADEGYGYVFADDPLASGAFTPNDARIVVAGRPARVLLVRPRTAFIAELLKSVESL
ncbi:MAG: hypothetical protein JOZ69_07860 [Myxococcales bacterium]|nr:hypothetical protein [Myxococcales bacterium]